MAFLINEGRRSEEWESREKNEWKWFCVLESRFSGSGEDG